jgi:hypothetical protein
MDHNCRYTTPQLVLTDKLEGHVERAKTHQEQYDKLAAQNKVVEFTTQHHAAP